MPSEILNSFGWVMLSSLFFLDNAIGTRINVRNGSEADLFGCATNFRFRSKTGHQDVRFERAVTGFQTDMLRALCLLWCMNFEEDIQSVVVRILNKPKKNR